MDPQLIWIFTSISAVMLISLHLFIKNAHRIGLSDEPNQRSSHNYQVVRGGGVVFGLSWLVACAYEGTLFSAFNSGLVMLMAIGLWDDLRGLPSTLRLMIQTVSVLMLIIHFELVSELGLIWTCLLILLFTYLINVFNFMDGINGILGLYSLTVFYLFFQSGFLELNDVSAFVVLMLSLISFLYYNFRAKAMVFSGDVGSLSISYLLIGGLIEMMLAGSPETNGLQFCLVFLIPLSIFMMDSLTTLLHRMWLRQNIFQSHRFHLYQILTPNIIRSQLPVSIGYALIQLLVTFLFRDCTDLRVLFLYLIILFSVFLFLRFVFLRKPSMLTER